MEKSRTESQKSTKVPYRERRSIRKYLVPRTVQLKRRKLKERTVLALAAASLVLLIYLIAGLSPATQVSTVGTPRTPAKIESAGKESVSLLQSPFFVYSGKNGKLNKSAICGIDRKSGSMVVILIEETFFIPILGFGVIDAKSLSVNFSEEFFASIANFFEFPLKGPYRVRPESLDPMTLRQSPNSLISDIKNLNNINLSKNSYIKSSEVVPSPTRLSQVGKKTVVVVDTARLNEAAEIMFSDSFAKKTTKGSIIILNGSGYPAAGSKVAALLVRKGFVVKTVRNAERFDCLITEIRSSNQKLASEIQKLLGYGEVKTSKNPIKVSDVLIIVGRDFYDK